ncbi:MAG: glycosyltransferase family 4 protein [Anaerolineales bacterium]
MNIFVITSVPMTPPWDQGDKNLAYHLTRSLPEVRFSVLTQKDGEIPDGHNLERIPVFNSGKPSLVGKAGVFTHLAKVKGDISAVHLIYRPFWISALLLRLLPQLRSYPKLHTVPATADGRSLNANLFFSQRIATISEYGKRALEKQGVENVEHIPPGIEVERWARLADQKESYKNRLGLSGHPVVLFPGHYGKGQGAELMFSAIPEVLSREPMTRFIFACRIRSYQDSQVERVIQQRLKEMQLEHAVHFFHRVPDMKTLIGACDMVALPLETMREKLDIPTSLLEALAARKPIIISDIAPMNEIIKQTPTAGPVGFATPAGDPNSLAEAIATLARNPEQRECMGESGQELIRRQYDIQICARKYYRIYQEITT